MVLASTRAAPERLAASVALLIERVGEPEVRAQLHALVPLLESLDAPAPDPAARGELEQAIDARHGGRGRGCPHRGDGEAGGARPFGGRHRRLVGGIGWLNRRNRSRTGSSAGCEDRGVDAEVSVDGRATVGLSQDTWFLTIERAAGSERAVLRLPTPASGTRAIITQRASLEAVAGRLPAPALLWHDDGEDNPFGRPFLVMGRVDGEVPVGWHDLPEPRRTRIGEHAMEVLAALHATDPGPLAAADGRRPRRADGARLVPAQARAARAAARRADRRPLVARAPSRRRRRSTPCSSTATTGWAT